MQSTTHSDIEAAALGAALRDAGCLRLVLEELQEDDLTGIEHRYVFRALRSLCDAGIDVDPATVAQELYRVGHEMASRRVADLVTVDALPAHAASYVRMIRAAADKRRAESEFTAACARVSGGDDAGSVIVDLVRRIHGDPASNGHGPPGVSLPAWPTLDSAALVGLAGDVVRTLEPHTEADPVALLMSFLAGFGNAAGPGPHMIQGGDHPARLFVVLVGETSRARKGTSWATVERVMTAADRDWATHRIMGGLASGEGLIAAVDDEQDRRVLALEPEFARVLAVAGRDGSTLSAIMRQAWDSGSLRVMTRNSPLSTSGAHVSIVGHVTLEELRAKLIATEAANGFANRFLFGLVRGGRILPFGGDLDPGEVDRLSRQTRAALQRARKVAVMRWSDAAKPVWEPLYYRMREEAQGGLVGAVTARAEAQALRLAVTYALLDGSRAIEVPHVEAAWALWRYCEASATYIFGDSLGDDVADRLLEAIAEAGSEGLSYDAQRDVFARNVPAARLEQARSVLEERGLIYTVKQVTGGRPRHVSFLHAVSRDNAGRGGYRVIACYRVPKRPHQMRPRKQEAAQ